ncbi:hypothetical protein SUGI_1171730 [Cryptomeria japonica]|uniref:uncharacterized protein LOC131068326 isoform X2 n=1 Tax=Cryptomeria japonica TaxID=3369 RepID=UPI002414BFE9|nr:uncharacterized protein LOC131068326 isoform X2 [Cryptomeria japonica]GLJ54556.1 hypothetical protein SUGI_1171730 [Cryptomeria japonica]
MASRLAVDQEVLDGVAQLLILKKGFEWLEEKLRQICGYKQAMYQLKAHDLSLKEWRQEVWDIVEHKEDEFVRLLPSCERGDPGEELHQITQEFAFIFGRIGTVNKP